MNILKQYRDNLYKIIIDQIPSDDETLIKIHTKCLGKLGDMSFPIPMKNWYNLIKKFPLCEAESILSSTTGEDNVEAALRNIIDRLRDMGTPVHTFQIYNISAHLTLERTVLFSRGIKKVLTEGENYGQWLIFSNNIKLAISNICSIQNIEDVDLTTLRMLSMKTTIENILKITTKPGSEGEYVVNISKTSSSEQSTPTILCGPVVGANFQKDINHKASDFFIKRTSDMKMLALHRYHISFKTLPETDDFFTKLGKGSITIELLSNKPCKAIQITPHSLSGTHKGASFIFYNCARLSTLLNEFNSKVTKGVYPTLPSVENIDVNLLTKNEEWELLYVYILQYPHVIRDCIRSLEKGVVNLHQLVLFLSNLAGVFSVYYSRVRILTDPREHMFGLIHSRIYLLKALQIVFHNALRILNIEPVKAM